MDNISFPCTNCITFAICRQRYIQELPKDIPDHFVALESIFYFMNECTILTKWVLSHDCDREECFMKFSEYYDSYEKGNET